MKKKIKFLIPDILVSQNTAIIGNSSSILKKKNGLKIEICDDVIRFNNAKTKGFEEYVGKNLVLKRGRPRARGRYGKILKPFSQLTIKVKQILANSKEEEKA